VYLKHSGDEQTKTKMVNKKFDIYSFEKVQSIGLSTHATLINQHIYSPKTEHTQTKYILQFLNVTGKDVLSLFDSHSPILQL